MIQLHYNISPAIECDFPIAITHMGSFSKLVLIRKTYYHPNNHPSLAIKFQSPQQDGGYDVPTFCTWSSQKKIKFHFLSST
jgi:hypothetical protein